MCEIKQLYPILIIILNNLKLFFPFENNATFHFNLFLQ